MEFLCDEMASALVGEKAVNSVTAECYLQLYSVKYALKTRINLLYINFFLFFAYAVYTKLEVVGFTSPLSR